MGFDTKVAIAVREDLATWQKRNVACFLSGGLVGLYPELAGECYVDASGQIYGLLVRQPILVLAASAEELRRMPEGSGRETRLRAAATVAAGYFDPAARVRISTGWREIPFWRNSVFTSWFVGVRT
jgi:hypothetical protein